MSRSERSGPGSSPRRPYCCIISVRYPMMTRALIFFFSAFLAILLYEYAYGKFYRHRQVPLTLGFFLMLCVLVFRVSSAYVGALAAISLFPGADSSMASIRTAAGLFAGIWSAAVLLQLAQNAVRVFIGEPARPVSFIRIFPPKPERKTK